MANKALITPRSTARSEAAPMLTSNAVEGLGMTVEHHLPAGALVAGDDEQLASLESQGYRVKLLTDTNILEIGAYRIDIETPPPTVPANLEVPRRLAETWPHHLVQLSGPQTDEWLRAIEARGVDVVEPISAYGLFVVGPPDVVNALAELPFVDWVGPFKPAYRIAPSLQGLRGRIRYVGVSVYPRDDVAAVKEALAGLNVTIIRETPPTEVQEGQYATLIVEVNAGQLPRLAAIPSVRWLEFASAQPGFDGERETQIMVENLDGAPAPNTAPVVGYQPWLATVGLTGAGVAVAICDTGVDANANNNASGHLDLRGRQVAFVDYTGGGAATDTNGHGTHVAGIAVGNAATGQVEAANPNNFLWGQGMAPQAGFVAQNALLGPWPPADFGDLTQDAVTNGAEVMNNSWFDGGGAGAGYTANARRFDELVRDPDKATATLDHLVIVFSAGNAGPNPSTITPPKEAKNPITVGNSLTFRPNFGAADDIRGIARSSSRGPALDGRILPNVVAPGTNVSSAWSETGNTAPPPAGFGPPIPNTGTPDPGNPANRLNEYMFASGTSMAAPHVAGGCALLTEWWRNRTGGRNPSPALLKALLINGAEDLVGGPSGRVVGGNPVPLAAIPNNDQGWGRVSLENILLQAPASDRGPRIFSDQRHAFTANGQEHLIRVAPVDPASMLRITLVWTDAPGAAGSNPALVNDLDLEVTELATGNIFRGNVFANGSSTTGGAFDNRNNVECVYLQAPAGTYEVRVIAAAITADARPPHSNVPWQDFALVIENAEVPAAAPVGVVPVIDRSGSMIFYGYEAVTRTSSKQFVDLLGIDDQLGVVSFGDTGDIAYPAGAAPALQTITGAPERTAANAAIDNIAFGGCTFMGDGIAKGRNLLATATGAQALVLLSDGYDNKGCDPTNPARPSALAAVATLPATLPVYTCAMGPSSDQALLGQIAGATAGRYYYMPTIDDLFEIYNYIRGQVSGDAIVANESAFASSSRVAAFVDALASEATFTVAWADPTFKLVSGKPRERGEVSIQLRDPRGQLVHGECSYLRRIVGPGYVVFELQDPHPGEWFVEVSTNDETHLRYTVGGFVRSPLRLALTHLPGKVVAGTPVRIAAQVFDGKEPIAGYRARVQAVAPTLGIPALLKKHKRRLQDTRPARELVADGAPDDIARLMALRNALLAQQQPDLFATQASTLTLRDAPVTALTGLGLAHLLPGGPTAGSTRSGILTGLFNDTQQHGSYNLAVTATGIAPASNTRFVRKELISVLVQ